MMKSPEVVGPQSMYGIRQFLGIYLKIKQARLIAGFLRRTLAADEPRPGGIPLAEWHRPRSGRFPRTALRSEPDGYFRIEQVGESVLGLSCSRARMASGGNAPFQ